MGKFQFLLLIILQQVIQGFYNRVYLKESNFYLAYEFTGGNINFKLSGHYNSWIALGFQNDEGNEDIFQIYQGSTPGQCEIRDMYRISGTSDFILDTSANLSLTGGNTIGYCSAANNNNWDIEFQRPQDNTLDLLQDLPIMDIDKIYKINFYKGYITANADDSNIIDTKYKYLQSYSIPFYSSTSPQQNCISECSEKLKTCTSDSDYITFNTVSDVQFQYDDSTVTNKIPYCFKEVPPFWNKIYDQTDYAVKNFFVISYNVVYLQNKEFQDSQEWDETLGPVNSQQNSNTPCSQKGFIYLRFQGQNINPAFQGYIGFMLSEQSNPTPVTADLLVLTVDAGNIKIHDTYLSQYDRSNSDTAFTLTGGLNEADIQFRYIAGEKNSDTLIYDVTVIRPLESQDTSQDIDLSNETIEYEIKQFYGSLDIFTTLASNGGSSINTVWSNVKFERKQICGYKCENLSTSEMCLQTYQSHPAYLCQTEYCNGPEPENCLQCHQDCKKCVNSYSSSCKECQDSDNKILYDLGIGTGPCITKRALFWNKIEGYTMIGAYPQTTIFYGLDASLSYIYFRIKGGIIAQSIGIEMTDGTDTEKYEIYQFSGQLQLFSTDNIGKLINADIVGTEWDITFFRSIKKLGANNFEIIYNTQNYNIKLLNGINLTSATSTDSSSTVSITLNYKQNCHPDCKKCIGPEKQDCLECNSPLEFEDTIPGECKSGLLQCQSPLQIRYKNLVTPADQCINKYPQFWNKIDIQGTQFQLYYGFELDYDINSGQFPEYIYFRLVGYNEGWVAIGFGQDHNQVDMAIILLIDGKVVIQDRYSHNAQPEKPIFDSSYHYRLIEGNYSDRNIWDVTIVRSIKTMVTNTNVDLQDKNLEDYINIPSTPNKIRQPFTLALGDSHDFIKHSTYKRNFILFKTEQECDLSCLKCVGPEKYHCIQCNTDIYNIKNNTPPNTCEIKDYYCHILCKTCYGPAYTECLSCVNTDQIAVNGNCLEKNPVFWNKIAISNNLDLFYGYSVNFQIIYFKIKGQISPTIEGWVGLGFGDSMNNMDQVILRKKENIILVEDRYSENSQNPPQLDQELNQKANYYYISGTRTGPDWDVQFMRFLDTEDSLDEFLDITLRKITIAWGDNDLLKEHGNGNGGGHLVLNDIRFRNYQVCSQLCLYCVGPENSDCLKCMSGYELIDKSGVPSSCQVEKLICHPDCSTDQCTSTSRNSCLQCSDFLKFSLFGTCKLKEPIFWNKIKVNDNLSVYYGFDSLDQVLYLRFKGQNLQGWVGMGFNDEMRNTDMIIIRKDLSVQNGVIIEDRYSLGHTVPLEDSRQSYVQIEGQWIIQELDVTVARLKNTKDTVRDQVLDHEMRNLIFAFGESNDFSDQTHKHSTYQIIQGVKLSFQQECPTNCISCTGPEDSECQNWNLQDDQGDFQIIIQINLLIVTLFLVALL